MKNKPVKNKIIIASSIIAFIIVVLPIIVTAYYSYFQADDFSHATGVGVFNSNIVKLLVASLKFDKHMYFNWQGTYTSMFLQAFLSPLNGYGWGQLRIVMIFNVVLFVFALVVFVYSLCRYANISLSNTILLISLCTIGIFGFTSWTEVFCWFSGAVSYSFPLAFGLFGIALFLNNNSKLKYILAVLCMFAASGGSTEVAGFCCFILLSLCIVKKSRGDISRKDYIIFTISVLGAVINTVAPGNYVRHSSADSTGLHILGGGIDTINVVTKITEKIFANTPYVIVFLIAVFVGIYMGKTSKYQEINGILSVTCGLCCVLPFVTGFPVCLGYSSDAYFPNRCEFVETVSIIISSLVIAIVVGYFIGIYVDRVAITEICVVLLVFIIQMQNINSNWKISETVPYQIWQQLGNNEFGEYYDNVKELYEYISKDDNEDVFIYQLPTEIANFSSVSDSVTEDMNCWTNIAISSYFGKSSVQYVKSPVWTPSDDSVDRVIRISPDMFEQECNFVSIFIKNDDNQSMDIVQVLEPLVSNKVITIPNDQNGEVAIYVFGDMEGKELLDELIINY